MSYSDVTKDFIVLLEEILEPFPSSSLFNKIKEAWKKLVFAVWDLEALDDKKLTKMIVVLSPWHDCPVAFFSIVLGIAISKTHKYSIEFLIDDILYPEDNQNYIEEISQINIVAEILKNFFKVDYLSSERGSICDDISRDIADCAKTAALFDAQSRAGTQSVKWPIRSEVLDDFSSSLFIKGKKISAFIGRKKPSAILVPGGSVNGSYLYFKLAQDSGIRCATFDSGVNLLQIGVNSIAALQKDIFITYEYLLTSSTIEQDFARRSAREYLRNRQDNGDKILRIVPSKISIDEFDVVFCMNFEGDAAAIGLDLFFESAKDWLCSSIEELNNANKYIRIAVRQHPDERNIMAYQSIDALDNVRLLKNKGINVEIFEAISDVSTYELAKKAKTIVVGTTTFGIEAAMLGKSVIVSRESYYSDCSFIIKPKSKSDYFTQLLSSVSGYQGDLENNVKNAELMYYCLELCNRISSEITPIPDDFRKWLRNNPQQIFQNKDFQMCVSALSEGFPYSLLKHKSLLPKNLST